MDGFRRVLVFLLLIVAFALPAAAEDAASQTMPPASVAASSISTSEALKEQMEGSGASGLYNQTPQQAKSRLDSLGLKTPNPDSISKLTPRAFFSMLLDDLGQAASVPLKSLSLVMGVLLLYALLSTMKTSLGEKPLKGVFDTVCALCVAGAVLTPLSSCIRYCSQTIVQSGNFCNAFLVVFSGLVAASGHPASSVVFGGLMALLSDAVINLASTTFVPMVGVYLAFCLVGSVAPGVHIAGLASFVKKVVVWGLGLCTTIFVGLLTVQGLISGAADTVAVKTAKFMVGSFIPVVGGSLSDALNTVMSCANLLKTATGAYAIIVFLVIFLPPVLECVLWMLAMDLSAAVAEILGIGNMKDLLKGIRESLSVMTALVVTTATALIVSVSVMLLTGTGN